MAGFVNQSYSSRDWQTDYIKIVTFDSRDPTSGITLDAISSGFVQRLLAGEIPGEFRLGDDVEGDLCDLNIGEGFSSGKGSKAGKHLVSSPGE